MAAGLVAPFSVQALDVSRFPERATRIIVPFPPGGAADVFARLAGQKLSEVWGGRHTVVADNRPGAGGIIGTTAAVKATPDGYTYLIVTVGHAINPAMYSKLPYDSATALTAVGMVATVPSLVVVSPSFRGTTLKDLIAAARAKPGEIQ
jgi:tripartite-type tricarboxylate transporter receptor subunit TctC